MSIQSMKYHNLPTIKQIEAYNSGRMSTGERKWMDSMIKRNPFVKESVEAAKTVDMAAAGRISSYVSSNVTSQYLTRAGFWSKYGGWISFSSIAVIIGLGAYFGPDLYNEYTTSENIVEVVEPETDIETTLNNTSENTTSNSSNNSNESNVTTSNNDNITESEVVSTEGHESNESESDKVIQIDDTEKESSPEDKIEEKKETKDPTPKEATLTVLSAKKVFISSKFDPDNKSTTNFPTYPGGDLALCDYFKNKLRPIQVPDAGKYSKKATIVLHVNSKGKITSSSISGNIHPTHESALNSAINNLPKFDSGKSKVQYSVVVSF